MTREELIDRIETLLGKGYLYKFAGHDLLPFDKNTKNVEIIPGHFLHEFLTNNTVKTNTWINTKILAELATIRESTDVGFSISQTSLYKYETPLYEESVNCLKWHWQGHAIDIVPDPAPYIVVRELYKTIRKVKPKGAAIFYDTHIHLDCMNVRRVDLRTKKKV